MAAVKLWLQARLFTFPINSSIMAGFLGVTALWRLRQIIRNGVGSS